MKYTFLCALAAAVASAQETTVIFTNNECFKGEGGRFKEECSDVYFFNCHVYEVQAAESCNVFVFSDSRITATTSEIEVHYWSWLLKQTADMDY
jgi:hypothetical protein